MKSFLKAVFFKNGGTIKHLRNRSVKVYKTQLPNMETPSVIIEFKRWDNAKDFVPTPSALTHFRMGAEFTGISLSQEAALALAMLLDDYFKRVDKKFLSNFIEEPKLIINEKEERKQGRQTQRKRAQKS